MKRKEFLQKSILGLLGLSLLPKIIKDNDIEFDEVDQSIKVDNLYKGFDFSNIECYYDFTNDDYSIKDPFGNIVAWRDLSGNGHHGIITTANPHYPYRKFAISKKMNEAWTDDFTKI